MLSQAATVPKNDVGETRFRAGKAARSGNDESKRRDRDYVVIFMCVAHGDFKIPHHVRASHRR